MKAVKDKALCKHESPYIKGHPIFCTHPEMNTQSKHCNPHTCPTTYWKDKYGAKKILKERG